MWNEKVQILIGVHKMKSLRVVSSLTGIALTASTSILLNLNSIANAASFTRRCTLQGDHSGVVAKSVPKGAATSPNLKCKASEFTEFSWGGKSYVRITSGTGKNRKVTFFGL
jgi:hypothetical protein